LPPAPPGRRLRVPAGVHGRPLGRRGDRRLRRRRRPRPARLPPGRGGRAARPLLLERDGRSGSRVARRSRPRLRVKRILRVILAVLVALLLLCTVAAFAIDVSPLGASRPARSLYAGPYVQVGATLVAYRRWGTRGTP